MKKKIKYILLLAIVIAGVVLLISNKTSFNRVLASTKSYKDDNETVVNSTKLTSLSFDGYKLTPEFDKDTTTYNISITDNTIDLIPNYTVEDPDAKVDVTGNLYLKNKAGSFKITVSKTGVTSTVYTIKYRKTTPTEPAYNFDYTGKEQTFTPLYDGVYKLETWGAQGGSYSSICLGGYGGYSVGNVKIKKNTTLYVNVGGKGSGNGSHTAWTGGYNGGGNASINGDGNTRTASGGGATHIATKSGLLSTFESSKDSILIVAGGGGGQGANSVYGCSSMVGGSGGGATGSNGDGYSNPESKPYGAGGTQTAGGNVRNTCTTIYCNNGSFGQGANSYVTGAGGGLYGGGTNSYASGGGSGYIGNSLLTDKHMYCYNCGESDDADSLTTSDTCSFEDATEDCAKEGNGYAKISLVRLTSGDYYLTSLTSSVGTFDKTFNPTTKEYNLTIPFDSKEFTLGGTTSNENADVVGFTKFSLNSGETKKISIIVTAENGDTTTYIVNATREAVPESEAYLKSLSVDGYTIDFDSTTFDYDLKIAENTYELGVNAEAYGEGAKVTIDGNSGMFEGTGKITITVVKSGKNKKVYTINYAKDLPEKGSYSTSEFLYTGDVQTFEAPATGTYKVELWGGSGFKTAYGGYTSGDIKLTKGTKLYVYVGNIGTTGNDKITFNNGTGNHGGFNGGGATDVRLEKGSSWNDFNSLKSRIMVAGAGGSTDSGIAGAAGGLTGYSGNGTKGGTQTSFGAVQNSAYTASSFGIANGGCTGGNGYYPGGGATCASGAGGGSSFISGHTGSIAITEDSTSGSIRTRNDSEGNACTEGTTDIECSKHYSNYVFTDTKMVDGQGYSWSTVKGDKTGMPSYSDSSVTVDGNNGAGHARITAISVSNNNFLKSLSTNIGTPSKTSDTATTGEWSEIFTPGVTDYDLALTVYQREITVSAEAYDDDATVIGTDKKYIVEPGKTVDIPITVTSAAGIVKTYTIHAKRASLPSTEHSTKLNSLEVKGFPLTDTFDPYANDLNVLISGNTIDLDITATSIDPDNKITITGDKYLKNRVGFVKIVVEDTKDSTVEPTTYLLNYVKETVTDTDFGFDYTGNVQEWSAPYTGKYQFQAWGASGGNTLSDATKGGNGAYTSGNIYLNKNDKIYIYVGGQGTDSSIKTGVTAGGYNGGGNAYNSRTSCSQQEGSGGGATDFRLNDGSWNDAKGLASRIMVAAGGGGAYYEYCNGSDTANVTGAAGGALIGGQGIYISRAGYSELNPTGATQTTGGKSLSEWTSTSYDTNYIGKFGIGSSGRQGGYSNSGAGGGYYGGASGGWQPGSGGSSFISGYTGSVAVKSQNDMSPRIASDRSTCADGTEDNVCSVHYSEKVFDNTVMTSGTETMPNHTETDTMTGNEGNGYAKIKFLNLLSGDYYLTKITSDIGTFDKDFDPLTNEYTLNVTPYDRVVTLSAETSDEDAKVVGTGKYTVNPGETKDATIVVTALNGDTKTYTVHILSQKYTGKSTLLKSLSIDKYELNPDFNSKTLAYSADVYTSDIDLSINAVPFDNEAEVKITGNRYIGSTGTITIKVTEDGLDPTTYTISYTKVEPEMNNESYYYTGDVQEWTAPFNAKYKFELWGGAAGYPISNSGQGGYTVATMSIRKGTTLYIYAGGKGGVGHTGGWNGGGNGGNTASTAGGGATDIRLTKGETWDDEKSLYSRILVAGGGGGSDDGYTSTSNDGRGGHGGGLKAQGTYISGGYYESYGGTQISGYALGKGASTTSGDDSGGAGGGYWGGLASNSYNGGGGGGSSYIKGYPGTDDTYLEYQGGDTVRYVEGEMQQGGNSGAGYVKISFVGLDSDDVYLTSLESDNGTFNKEFDKLDGNYTLTLDKYTGLFTLSGEPSDSNASVTGFKQYSIDNGETKEIPITVTSESGMVKVYIVTAKRDAFPEGEHSSKLKSLTFDDYQLNEDFYSTITDYTMNINDNEIDTNVHYTLYDPTATVKVESDKYIKHSPVTIKITVSAEGCEDTVYRVVTTMASTGLPSRNNYLTSIETSNGTLDPKFDVLKNEYTVNLSAYEAGTRITGTVDNEDAFADGLDKYYTVDNGKSRDVKITVTAPSGDIKVYTITLKRADYTDEHSTYLKSLSVSGYENDIDFDPKTQEYNLTIANGIVDLPVNAVAYDSDAKVEISNTKHLSDNEGSITVTVKHSDMEDRVYTINYTRYESSNAVYDYTGDYQTFVAPYTGTYTFEAWGAQGGTSMDEGSYTGSYSRTGGKGAYTKGKLNLKKGDTFYIYVGGKGADAINRGDAVGGYNGGGNGTWDHSDNESAGAGGGATDIRLIDGKWNYNFGLASRIMVAAGGGGAAYNEYGGAAGALTSSATPYIAGASQTTGYQFGIGQNGVFENTNVEVAGAGGGYFGGQSKSSGRADVYRASGSGGSSFISGYKGAIAIKSLNDTSPRLDSNGEVCTSDSDDAECSVHYSGIKFDDTEMIDGNNFMPTHDGSSTMVGNTGNGYVRITMEKSHDNYLNSLESNYGKLSPEFDSLSNDYTLTLDQYESTFTLSGEASNQNANVSGLGEYTIDNGEEKDIPVTVTAPNGDVRTYNVHAKRDAYTDTHSTKLKSLSVKGYEEVLSPKFTPTNTNYSVSIDDSEADIAVQYEAYDPTSKVTVKGDGVTSGDDGTVTITVTSTDSSVKDTVYSIAWTKTEVPENTEYTFDYTGEGKEFIVPTSGEYKLEVWGAQGAGKHLDSSAGTGGNGGYSTGTINLTKDQKLYVYVGGTGTYCNLNGCTAKGGFNGGGDATKFSGSLNDPAMSGGGATDIRLVGGAWNSSDSLLSRFIVAGGGGGGGMDGAAGGAGGGINGTASGSSAGSQTTGFAFGYGASATKNSTTNATYGGPGAGGGWYGGTISNLYGGGGGSGFVLTGTTATNAPAGYTVTDKYYLSNAETIAGNASLPTHDGTGLMYGNSGDGYVKITLLKTVSKNNYLSELNTDYGTFDKEFSAGELEYNLHLGAYDPQFKLTGKASDEKAKVEGLDKIYKVKNGETKTINVTVTATAGNVRTYTINVTRDAAPEPHTTKLSSLIINSGTEDELIPGFNSKKTEYTLSVYPNIADLMITTETYDSDNEVTITGNNHLADEGTVKITVHDTADSSTADTVYTINYTRDKKINNYTLTKKDKTSLFEYTGSYQTYIAPSDGKYLVQLWGAQGNYVASKRSIGGKGAYTKGIVDLKKNDILYVYVGENRTDRNASWNAGSVGGASSDSTNGGGPNGYGGGGATDVRLNFGSWNSASSLASRIMVAAGGGGASNYAYPANGGAAGALTGFSGENGKYPTAGQPNTPPSGATQTIGGKVGTSTATYYPGAIGQFGIGGNGYTWGSGGGGGYFGGSGGGCSDYSVDSGAGGSSFISGYTGSVAIKSQTDTTPRLDSNSEVCQNGTTDNICSIHYSGKTFEDTEMKSGKDVMPNHDGTGTMTGNTGNGYAKISQILIPEDAYLTNLVSSYGTFTRHNSTDKTFDPLVFNYDLHLTEDDPQFTLTATTSDDTATVAGDGTYEVEPGETMAVSVVVTAASGDTRTYVINVKRDKLSEEHTTKLSSLKADESLVYSTLSPEFNSKITDYNLVVSYNTIDLDVFAKAYDKDATIDIVGNKYMKEKEGDIYINVSDKNANPSVTTYTIHYKHADTPTDAETVTYEYNDAYQTFVAPHYGLYKFEAWGAAGGDGKFTTATNEYGGLGAYTSGRLKMKKGDTVYVYVGGQGESATVNTQHTMLMSSFNGGAPGVSGGTDDQAASGGGATDFRLLSGNWDTTNGLASRIMVAAGGGGGHSSNTGSYNARKSFPGINGQALSYRGNIGQWQGGLRTASVSQTSGASFGIGSHYTSLEGVHGAGGGGGGYFGGTANLDNYGGAGAGGSSYISGYTGSVAIKSSSDISARLDSEGNVCTDGTEDNLCSIHYSGISFSDGNMIAGSDEMPNHDGTATMTGNSGNGYAKVSPVIVSLDNYLTSLTASTGKFREETFDPLNTEYNLDIDLYDEYVTIGGTLSDEKATVTGFEEYRLDVGEEKDIPITVTSENGDVRTYTIHARRGELKGHSSKLKSLDFDTDVYIASPDPRFASRTYEYNIEIPSGEINLSYKYTTYDKDATVKVVGDKYIKEDTGVVKFIVSAPDVDDTTYVVNYTKSSNFDKYKIDPTSFDYTGKCQTFTSSTDMAYKLQTWGAAGGYDSDRGGYGGYAEGAIELKKDQKIYICVGGVGASAAAYGGGFNGGGGAGYSGSSGAGGGATHIALTDHGILPNYANYKDEILIVAGAGGGGGNSYGPTTGGAGGGLTGLAGAGATGGTQTSGGSGGSAGTFGQGGQRTGDGGGGGGGYYGGGASAGDGGGAGGSSYIAGVKRGKTIDGNSSMPTHDNKSTMNGNTGNGYARISPTTLDKDNYLLSLSTDKAPIEFDKFKNDYSIEVDSEVTDITISAKPSSDTATIDGVGTFDLPAGVNVFPVKVTSEYGDTRTYTITVTRPESSTSRADNITVTGLVDNICKAAGSDFCNISPSKFSSDTYTYSLRVPAGIREINFAVEKGHKYETVVGEGTVKLRRKGNTFTISITSEDQKHETKYVYNVYRDMTGDNYLDSIEVQDPTVEKEDFDFNYLITEYSFKVPNDNSSIKLKIVPDDQGEKDSNGNVVEAGATFRVIGNGDEANAEIDTADSSIVTINNLEVGANTVEIEVTAATGEKRSYVLNVYRMPNSNNFIKTLTVTGSDNNEYVLGPTFAPEVTSYTLSVPNEVSYINIAATPDVSTTKIAGAGKINLATGANKIEVTSTAQSGDVSVYTIIVTRAKSSNANLKSLSAKEGTFNEKFDKDTTDYSLTVEAHKKSLTINAVPEDDTATYVIKNNANFRIGKNTVSVVVTAEDGTVKTYNIVVNKEGSDDNLLKAINSSEGTVSPTFNSNTNEYTLDIPNETTSVTITGVPNDTLSTVSGNGTYKLATGENDVNLVVTSETGKQNTYVVKVIRAKNSNNNLKDIKIKNGEKEIKFDFDPETTSYSINVDNSVDSINIEATPEVKTTTIPENGDHTLETGLNTIILHSTAENGDIKEYILSITRGKNSDASLQNLFTEEAILNPKFNKSTLTYTGTVPSDVDTLHVHAIPSSDGATYVVSGNENLKEGKNEISVLVTAEDGKTQIEYKMLITKTDKVTPYLKSLSATGCDIKFDKNKQYYTCEVPYETTSTDVKAEVEKDPYEINGKSTYSETHKLKVGINIIGIPVTYEEGGKTYERDYIINYTRRPSTESRLDNMVVSDINNESLELTPKFDKDETDYTLTTNEYDVEFKYDKLQEDETVEITGNHDLKLGENTVTVKSTAQDKEHVTEYTFTVTRTIRSDAYLKSLSIDAGEFTPSFNKEVTNYYLNVPYDISSGIVKAEAEDRNATVHGTNLRQFNVGANKIDVTVIAEDGTQKVYTINVTRLGNPNNYLKSLEVEGYDITPSFNRETSNYTLTVPFETDKVNVIAEADSEDATVIGAGEVELEQGENSVPVVVTAGDGSIRTYTINITRKDPITPYLKDIKIKNYTIDPTFDSYTMDYAVEVDYETTSLNLIITKLDPYSTYVIEDNKNFKVGLNTVKVVSTSSNRKDTVTYTITVNRKSYSNTFLSSLTVNQGELDPKFVKTTMEYNVEVANSVSNITVDGTADYALSTVTGFGNYDLKVGKNVIHIVVTSPAGIQRTYIVNVSRRKSNNANVTSITSNIGTLSQNKDDSYTYTLTVPKYTKNIGRSNFKVITEDPDASVSMPITINLNKTTTYRIKVTSPDGSVTKYYDIDVKFDLSDDATLSALIPSVGELSPKYDRETNEYSLSLYDDVDSVYFDAYLNEINAKLINKSLNYNLTEEKTDATITVQAENGNINIYTVHINRDKTKQKYLSNIVVTNIPDDIKSPAFRPETFEYSLDVPYDTDKIGFDITKKHSAQKISINGMDYKSKDLIDLAVGENDIPITVTNDLGEQTIYTYKITRGVSTNTNLKSLRLTEPNVPFTDSEGKTLEFDKDTLVYNAEVDYVYENIGIEAIPEDPNAEVVTQGSTYLTADSENEITITVKAPSGDKKVYTIYALRRPNVNNLLKTITVSSGTIYDLDPEFRPGHSDYNLTVGSAISHVRIEPVPELTGTTVTITDKDGNEVDATPEKIKTDEDKSKLDYNLEIGNNSYTIKSTRNDDDGNPQTRTYTLNISRLEASNAFLKDLIINNGTLVDKDSNPDTFAKTKFEYYVSVPSGTTKLDMTPIPEDNTATYVVKGNDALTYEGDNLVTISVTSSNGKVTQNYNLHVKVKGSSNNYLSDLQVGKDEDNLKTIDGFQDSQEVYYLTVPNSQDSIYVKGVTADDGATIDGNGIHELNPGVNEINIKVKAQDDSIKTYTIYVTRKENAYIDKLITNLPKPNDEITLIKDTFEYDLGVVDHDVSVLNLKAILGDTNATIDPEGLVSEDGESYKLDVGDNNIEIVVKNGSSKSVYNIKVNRKGSSNVNLTHLTSADGKFDKEYSNDEDEYTIHINDYKNKISLDYAPEDNATITVLGNSLTEQENTVTLHIVAEDGETTRDITLHVFKEPDSYFTSDLDDLYVDEASLSPTYKKSVKDYTVTVDNKYDKIHIHAISSNPKTKIEGAGEKEVALGKNTFTITSTAEDGTVTTYTILAYRKDPSNADLTGLYVEPGELIPKFDPKTYSYDVDVPMETPSVTVTAVGFAEKKIQGDGVITLLYGGTTVDNVIVTSEDGHTKVYKITIHRPLSNNPDITNIVPSTGSLDQKYDKNVTDYYMTVPDSQSTIKFDVTTASYLSKVTGDTERSLEYGDNLISIYAQSEDGTLSTIYNMHVHRIHDLTDIEVPGDVTGPKMDDGSENHISIQPGGQYDLLGAIKFIPEDADYKDLIFTSNDTSVATVDENGIITGSTVLGKKTTITVQSKQYPSIKKTINVTIEITLITSKVYDIEREKVNPNSKDKSNYNPYITNIELNTNINTFFSNLDNDPKFLRVCAVGSAPEDDSETDSTKDTCEEITDLKKIVGTQMQVQLVSNHHIYDRLNIVVYGDVNGDGKCMASDSNRIKQYLVKTYKLSETQFLASDVSFNSKVQAGDLNKIKQYLVKSLKTFVSEESEKKES